MVLTNRSSSRLMSNPNSDKLPRTFRGRISPFRLYLASALKIATLRWLNEAQVARLHPRGTPRVFQAPQCPYLWGSFQERQQHVQESTSTSNESPSVGDGGGTTEETHLDEELRGRLSCDVVPIESRSAESPSSVQGIIPEVHYRVRLGEGVPNPPRGSHNGESEERNHPPQHKARQRSRSVTPPLE